MKWVPVDIFIVVVIVVAVIIVVVIVVVGVDDLRDEVRGEEDGGDHAEHSGRRLGGGRRAGKVFTPTLASKDVRLIEPHIATVSVSKNISSTLIQNAIAKQLFSTV